MGVQKAVPCQERDAILDFCGDRVGSLPLVYQSGGCPNWQVFSGKRMINRRGFGLPVQTSHNIVLYNVIYIIYIYICYNCNYMYAIVHWYAFFLPFLCFLSAVLRVVSLSDCEFAPVRSRDVQDKNNDLKEIIGLAGAQFRIYNSLYFLQGTANLRGPVILDGKPWEPPCFRINVPFRCEPFTWATGLHLRSLQMCGPCWSSMKFGRCPLDRCSNRNPDHPWPLDIPIGSMYGIYANIGDILMVNVTIYSIHGSYGIYMSWLEFQL